jgi:CRP/FNR family transcriptional activator FtrB
MKALRSELACNAGLGAALARAMAELASEFADDLLQLKLRTTVDRLGSYLLALADGSDGQAVLPYEKKLVAANLGMSPESLSRAFAQLRSLGVSLVGRRVQFVDPEALRQRFGTRPPNRPRVVPSGFSGR